MNYLMAIIYSIGLSIRYQFRLKIKIKECKKYYSKSLNLAICYVGFSPVTKIDRALGAGKAAFYCCAYDVVTDWRYFNPNDLHIFNKILSKLDHDVRTIALKLYSIEKNEKENLKDNGLERGVIALEFISKLMRVEDYIKTNINFYELGIIMQIVDDVLDIEEDLKFGEMNCLVSNKRDLYLNRLIDYDVHKFIEIFPKSFVLTKVLIAAQNKARILYK